MWMSLSSTERLIQLRRHVEVAYLSKEHADVNRYGNQSSVTHVQLVWSLFLRSYWKLSARPYSTTARVKANDE